MQGGTLVRIIVGVTLWLAPARTSHPDDGPIPAQSDAPSDGSAGRERSRRAGSHEIRAEVDPQDARERFAILLPGGPFLVDATLTIDGEPFRIKRESLIDHVLAAGDVDHDGMVGWQEALQSRDFTCGRVLPALQRARFVRMLDWNRDGAVDRWEARGFLAAAYQGPAFLVTGGSAGEVRLVNGRGRAAGPRPSDVMAQLDSDDDGVLSQAEIADSGEKLQNRDVDGNELLYVGEIGGVDFNYRSRREIYTSQLHSILVEPSAALLFVTIRDKYQSDAGVVVPGCFWSVPDLFDQLDADRDRILSEDEAIRMNDVEPHMRVRVDISSGEGGSSLELTYVRGHMRPDDATDSAVVELPGVMLTLTAETAFNLTDRYQLTAEQTFEAWDGDGNGYLEAGELPGHRRQQFPAWDLDADGRVFPQEIVDSYAREQAPRQSQIQAVVRRVGDPLLSVLDLSGDSRLSLREMKTAHLQLASLDANGDGEISRREIPVSYAVVFRTGNRAFASERAPVDVARAPPDAPRWFLRMDRNGDGDVTYREFLGDRGDFETLDTNGDGFLEPAEAQAVSEGEAGED